MPGPGAPPTVGLVSSRLRPRRQTADAFVHDTWEWFWASFAGEYVRTFVELRGVDRALALASKCFVAVLPLSIMSTAVISGREFGEQVVLRFGLTGDGAGAARVLFAAPADVQ